MWYSVILFASVHVSEAKASLEQSPQKREKILARKKVEPARAPKSREKDTLSKGRNQEDAKFAASSRKVPGACSKPIGRPSAEKGTKSPKEIQKKPAYQVR